MRIDDLIEELRDDIEWARANEWETPIMLGDHIAEASEVSGLRNTTIPTTGNG